MKSTASFSLADDAAMPAARFSALLRHCLRRLQRAPENFEQEELRHMPISTPVLLLRGDAFFAPGRAMITDFREDR